MKKALLILSIAASLTATSAHAGSVVPPKPDYCKSNRCVLACYLPGRNMSTDTRLCHRLGLPLQWFVRAGK